MEELLKIWKQQNIKKAIVTFACGGDSMNDIEVHELECIDGSIPKQNEAIEFIEGTLPDLVMDSVEFYVNSDGHYMGESGTVEVALNEDGSEFTFDKNASSEWLEEYTEETEYRITEEEATILEKYVDRLSYNRWEGELEIDFKKDGVISDEDMDMITLIGDKIKDLSDEYRHSDSDGEKSEDSVSFETEDPIVMRDDDGCYVELNITASYYEYKESYE